MKIHRDDDMLHGSVEHYDRAGTQLAQLSKQAASYVDGPIEEILELPCGYGRVTRKLVSAFGGAHISVSDIMVPAVAFCVEEFGVTGIVAEEPVNELRNIEDGKFDLAIMGSLITHLSEVDALTILVSFLAKIRSGGCAVVTTHGERVFDLIEAGQYLKMSPNHDASLRKSYVDGQFGFVTYDADTEFERRTVDYIGPSYGVSITPRAWIENTIKTLGCSIVSYQVGGWDNHQDVVVIKR